MKISAINSYNAIQNLQIKLNKNQTSINAVSHPLFGKNVDGVTLANTLRAQNISFKGEDKKIDIKFLSRSDINEQSVEEIFEAMGVKVLKKDKKGKLIIDKYDSCKITDLGKRKFNIDENRLFKDVKAINDDAIFIYSEVNVLPSLETIGGDACFYHSQITTLPSLQTIGGSAFLITQI